MHKIIYTQRVEIVTSYNERRDCADQNISGLLAECGFLPFPVMNMPSAVEAFCDTLIPDGILFTGGNDLSRYGGDAPERDETERLLLEYARKKSIPVFGICRGMQVIACYFGGELEKADNHVGREHVVRGDINRKRVNSFHRMSLRGVTEEMIVKAVSDDGVIEAIQHKSEKIAGIMWHPEREKGFLPEDRKMLKTFFEKGQLI